jgi:hypothetical protein
LIVAVIAPGEGGAAGKEDVASPVLMELLCSTTTGCAGDGLFHSRDMFPFKNTLIVAVIAPSEGGAAGKEDIPSPVLMELLCGTTAGHGLFHSRDMFPFKNTLIVAVVAPGDGGAAGKEDVASPVLMELLCSTARHGLFLLQYVLQRVLHAILVEQANSFEPESQEP